MVYSASAVTAEARVHDQFYYLKRQLVAAGIGLCLLLFLVQLGYRRLEPLASRCCSPSRWRSCWCWSPASARWPAARGAGFDLGFIRFQPAEAAKVVLVLYLARSLSRRRSGSGCSPSASCPTWR